MKEKNNSAAATTIDAEEIERFSRISEDWWDEKGKFAPLHAMNPVRVEYIRDMIIKHFSLPQSAQNPPLSGITFIDIGCGGGLVCEPIARLGATVTAIDAAEKNIKIARLHAEKMRLDIDYRCSSAEELAETEEKFDVVSALEIIEHVADIELFIKSAVSLLKPGGLIILSTLNRTVESYALAIIGAEYILRLLPVGTHTWSKFLRPSELCRLLETNNVEIINLCGATMNPLTRKWKKDDKNLSVNYLVTGIKPGYPR